MKLRLSPLVPLVIFGLFALFPGVVRAEHSDTDISASLDELVGIWSSEGYGYVVEIQDGFPKQFQRYELNDVSCSLIHSGALEYFHQGATRVLRNTDATRFTYMLSGNITTYAYQRLDQLPEACRNGGTGYDADPLVNFDVFWSTFNEQYAFFEQRAMDWNSARDSWRSQLNSGSSNEELFAVLTDMVTPMCDGHVGLVSDFDSFNGEVNPNCWGDFLAHIFEEFQSQDQYSDPFEFYQMEFIPSVLNTVENEYIQGNLKSALLDKVLWGDLGGGVGYLNILQMAEYTGPDATPEEDLESIAAALDTVMASLADKQALVIDIRLNTGGYDHVALDIANRFVHQPRVSFTKKARWNTGYTRSEAYVNQPAGDAPFKRPIVILTSSLTASAAENFLLAMHSLPHVTVIGETTVGVHSDTLIRTLPNGWQFSLSNEIYESVDGTLFEGRGFTPDLEVASPRVQDMAVGRDYSIEAALEQLSTFKMNPGLNDAWYNPETDGQGFFITIFPELNKVSLAWFTYDTALPPVDAQAVLGDPGHRWLTALGKISGNQSVMNITLTSNGIFDTATDVQRTFPRGSDGTLTLTFDSCESGTVQYDMPSINLQGEVPIQRIAGDNISLCRTLNGEL